ncbi:MAG: 4Fe-4S dicluster domain-containing protein [Spirochaetota bacterium]
MDLPEIIRTCGVVGAGGAGFPTHVKVDTRVDTVVINGVECEPLLANDRYLLETRGVSILKGLELIMDSCGARRGYLAVKQKYGALILQLQQLAGTREDIEVFPVGDFYPAGDEYVLVNEITGRLVPEGGIPPQAGCLVQNVETTTNIFEAYQNQTPVTRRHLTCTGEVKEPSIVLSHIGATLGEVIAVCGGATVDDYVVIAGGPVMGEVTTDLDSPVTKTTGGILVLPRIHPLVERKMLPLEVLIKRSRTACCQCTYCTELCPRYLLGYQIQPHRIMRQIIFGLSSAAEITENAFLCSGCGLCEMYACVMGISPGMVNAAIKQKLSDEGFKPDFPEREVRVHEMREYRKVPSDRLVQRLQLGGYAEKKLSRAPLTGPERVEILLKQHVGAAASPVVRPEQQVREGELIADIPEGCLGGCVHASIEGKVTVVDEQRIIIERA